jgi:transcriptional regulator with XRE-family HTH domain
MLNDTEIRREAFKRFIKQRGLKVSSWAKRANVADSTIRNYTYPGSTIKSLSFTTLQKLANAEGVAIEDMFPEDEAASDFPTWHQRLIEAMDVKGWSVAELSRQSDVSSDLVHKYLKGKVAQPRGEILNKLANALGKHPIWLKEGIIYPAPVNTFQDGAIIDSDRLNQCLEAVEYVLDDAKAKLSAQDRAKIVTELYRNHLAQTPREMENQSVRLILRKLAESQKTK